MGCGISKKEFKLTVEKATAERVEIEDVVVRLESNLAERAEAVKRLQGELLEQQRALKQQALKWVRVYMWMPSPARPRRCRMHASMQVVATTPGLCHCCMFERKILHVTIKGRADLRGSILHGTILQVSMVIVEWYVRQARFDFVLLDRNFGELLF